MSSDYKTITQDVNQSLGQLKQQIPDTLTAFSQLAQSASKDGELSKKTKELIALAIGVAKQCDACIGFHTKTLIKLGVTEGEFTEMLGVAVYMGGGPSLMYAANAYKAYTEFLQN